MTSTTDDDRPVDHESLKALAKKLGRPLYTLHVLDGHTDPFLAGQPARRRDAEWFADVWNRVGGQRGFHLRRLHYRVISQDPPLLMPDGSPYTNTIRCVATLYNGGRDARHLGLIDIGDVIDRKNPEAVLNFKEAEAGEIGYRGGLDIIEPALNLPRLVMSPPTIAQRYIVEIWCEKSTMNDILVPLGERYGVNVVTYTGESSLTRCAELARRAEESGLPVRILYISDFDAAGAGMPVAAARKIEYEIYKEANYGLDIQVRDIVLTREQCEQYRLPSTPVEKDEHRGAVFMERFGVEGITELDALEALHPGELERILTREIERYYDTNLDEAVDDKANEIASELDDITQQVHEAHSEDIAKLRAEHKAVLAAIKSFKRKAAPILREIEEHLDAQAPDVDDFDWPEPEEGDEDPDPMFDSTRSYLDQVARYKKHQDKPTEAPERKKLDQYICICQVCGESFQSARPKARACSPSHRTALWRKANS
jgi:hypothetical protein